MTHNRTIIETPARGPGRPRDAKAHAAILDAAMSLTRDVGYDALAMDAIAARAGVSKATIYRYWPDKERLMAEAVEGIVRRVPPPQTGTTEGDLLVLMRATMAMYQDPATPPLLTGLIAAMARSPLIAERLRTGFIGVRREAIREVLRQGVRRGDLARSTDMELACDLLAGPMLWRSLLSGEPIHDAYTVALVRRVLRAFAPATRKPSSRGRST